MAVETAQLFYGFVEGDYGWLMNPSSDFKNSEQVVDDLTIARLQRKSPAEVLTDLNNKGFVKLSERIYAPQLETVNISKDVSFPGWNDADYERFTAASVRVNQEDDKVVVYQGEIVNPDDTNQTIHAIFIAAGGAREGLVTARGVYQMRYAMERAQMKGLPVIFFNAITSADPFFESEVGQISRQISDTMAFGLNLTVPKVTVVTGEAASAGAHAAWQIADTTLILDRGALLTVINPEEALQLLHFVSEVNAETNRKFFQQLRLQFDSLADTQLERVVDFIQGAKAIKEALEGRENILESEDQLRVIVRLVQAVSPGKSSEVMLIMPADNPRYVEGMLRREASMITIHADDWQKRAEKDTAMTKTELIGQVKNSMMEAQRTRTQDNTAIYFRLKTENFSEFWTAEDVKHILRELNSVGLSGIRFTETASVSELSQLTVVMREVETELGLEKGVFKICLSVENDMAIDQLAQIVRAGDGDRRVSTVVMGVRDYTKTVNGVKEREWGHALVERAKKRLDTQINQLREAGWIELRALHAVASLPNDYLSIHREVARALELRADGMLVISPEQILHVQAACRRVFSADGNINRDILQEVLQASITHIDQMSLDKNARQLLFEYSKISYQVFHEYRLKLLQAGAAFPKELQEMGIVDVIISPSNDGDYGEPLVRALWKALDQDERMDGKELRDKRLMKLAKLGAQALRKKIPIDSEVRQRKAAGRGQKAAQYWVDIMTKGTGVDEEILANLEPDTASDVLAKMGRRGSRSYAGQVQEAQEKTGTLAGIIAGYTKIRDRNVLLIIRDQDYINATAGASTGEIVRRACLDAVRKKQSGRMNDVAICYIDVSAGGRVQEGALALAPSELAVAGLVQAKAASIPVITVGHTYILGSDGIGPFYQADKIVLIGKNTELGLAGRRIVERVSRLGEGEFPYGFRLAGYHLAVGNIGALLEKPEELLPYLETILAPL